MTWRMLDLFSGIGGFSLAAQWCWGDDFEIVAFCEIDKFCQKVLKKHWPNVPIIEDVRDVKKKTLDDTQGGRCGFRKTSDIGKTSGNVNSSCLSDSLQSIDLLTGGFPCQPFSCAGKQKGKEDNRFLWPEMFRIIKEIRPRWVIAENVAGIVRMALDDCLSDLEGEGYSTQAIIIPACAVNAPHRRDRVWIVAHYDNSLHRSHQKKIRTGRKSLKLSSQAPSNDDRKRQTIKEGGGVPSGASRRGEFGLQDWWSAEPDVGRVAHGVPNRVDRLKSLGNAIVPQVAYQIMKAIKEVEESQKN